jgi:hypothetical protein
VGAGETDPRDADTDDDGVLDGAEPSPFADSDGDGLVDALDVDSDDDGLLDGTELGVTTTSSATDVARGFFVPDADTSSTTDPRRADTDRGSVIDGVEDRNGDGRIDAGETNPNLGADDVPAADTDGDGLADVVEARLGTDPRDADSDDDGVLDGAEPNYAVDSDGDGLINPLDPGQRRRRPVRRHRAGRDHDQQRHHTSRGHFVADADPSTTTNPLLADTDGGGVDDGAEDTNKDGRWTWAS